MTDPADLSKRLITARTLFREKIGGSKVSLEKSVSKKGHRLPRWVRKRARHLSHAEALLAHPKLRLTQDIPRLTREADELIAYLKGIDLVDQRKGWWLGMLGAMVFNLLVFMALLIAGLWFFGIL